MFYPVDERSEIALQELTQNLNESLNKCSSFKQMINTLKTCLPFDFAFKIELGILQRKFKSTSQEAFKFITNRTKFFLCEKFCETLISFNDKIYFMREDIVLWLENNQEYKRYFSIRDEEITFKNETDEVKLSLTQEQLIGIIIILQNEKNLKLISNVTNKSIDVSEILSKCHIYKFAPQLSTDKLKRPYQVDIYGTTYYFLTENFMKGVICGSLYLSGDDSLSYNEGEYWKNLLKLTREGLERIKLKF